MRRSLGFAWLSLALVGSAGAQQFQFPEAAVSDAAARSKAMPELARQTIAAYKNDDRDHYLDNLFHMQIVAGQYSDALTTMAMLRERLKANHPERAGWVNVQYEIYANAKNREQAGNQPFDQAYGQSFRDETIQDAGEPMQIQWYGDSYLDLPVSK